MDDAKQRADEFIKDIVEVCKKHRVLIRNEEFEEFPENKDYNFFVELDELKESIEMEVWNIIHTESRNHE